MGKIYVFLTVGFGIGFPDFLSNFGVGFRGKLFPEIILKKQAPAFMDFRFVINIFFRIFSASSAVFKDLADKQEFSGRFFLYYGMPLIILAAYARAYTLLVAETEITFRLQDLIFVNMAGFALSFWLGAYLIFLMSPSFKAEKSFGKILMLVIASFTPYFISMLIPLIHPTLAPVTYAGIAYTVLLFGKGAGVMLQVPGNKVVGFTLIAFFIMFGVVFLSLMIFTGLFVNGDNV